MAKRTNRERIRHTKICGTCKEEMKPVKVVSENYKGMAWKCIGCDTTIPINKAKSLKDVFKVK